MKARIYHNPRCRKSRAGLDYLKQKVANIEIVDYINEGISPEEVLEIMKMTGMKPLDLVRRKEEYFRKELKGKEFPREKWAEIISENPKLLQRPVVIANNMAVLGDPAGNINKILN